MTQSLAPITKIIEAMRAGKMVILVDDERRENEGDFVIPAQMASPEQINFMAKYGRGLICLAMSPQHIDRLELPMMVSKNECALGTAFTVSIDAAQNVTTGISAYDRSHTIMLAADPSSTRADFSVPGHIFPLRAVEGGVTARPGHTEASVELARLAGFNDAAVICEIMNDDGTMARLPDLEIFAQEHDLLIGSIQDLIAHVKQLESAA